MTTSVSLAAPLAADKEQDADAASESEMEEEETYEQKEECYDSDCYIVDALTSRTPSREASAAILHLFAQINSDSDSDSDSMTQIKKKTASLHQDDLPTFLNVRSSDLFTSFTKAATH